MCRSMVAIQSPTAEIRRGKKERRRRRRKKETGWKYIWSALLHRATITRMWASAQRDGRPAEYRWRPVFDAAKFGWLPLLECRAVTLPRRETRWNFQGCPQIPEPISAVSGPKFTTLRGHVGEILLLNKFFPIVDTCSVAKIQPDKVVRWCRDGDFFVSFLRLVFPASRLQHISDLHPKFALRPHHV